MPDFWSDEYIIKRREPAIRWYTMDDVIHIVASEGNMRREAIDAWADMIREVVDYIDPDEPMFIIVDLSAPSQGFTPYGGTITRRLLQYVIERRNARSYIGMVLSNSFINQIIATFFQQILSRTNYRRQAFTDPEQALDWMQSQIHEEARRASDEQSDEG